MISESTLSNDSGEVKSLGPLPEREFLEVIDRTALVSIDLIVRNKENEILNGFRKNRPAQGYWFVPGGRIDKRKDYDLNAAFERICREELGLAMDISRAKLLGVYTHKYQENFKGVEGISTYYIVLAYEIEGNVNLSELPLEQHYRWAWLSEDDLSREKIHENSAVYFQTWLQQQSG